MSIAGWGLVLGILGLIGPWVFGVHGKLAVLTEQMGEDGKFSVLAAQVERIEALLTKGNGYPVKCAVHDEQIASLRREVDGLWEAKAG